MFVVEKSSKFSINLVSYSQKVTAIALTVIYSNKKQIQLKSESLQTKHRIDNAESRREKTN